MKVSHQFAAFFLWGHSYYKIVPSRKNPIKHQITKTKVKRVKDEALKVKGVKDEAQNLQRSKLI